MSRFAAHALLALTLLLSFGCAMKTAQEEATAASALTPSPTTVTQPAPAPDALGAQPSGLGQKIVEEAIAPAPPVSAPVTMEPLKPLLKPSLSGLHTVLFDYDQHLLGDEARTAIAANAEILKANPQAQIQLAGHCDERGSDQYNIALGERRAESVRSYLVELGIAAGRLETVSYGEEQPLDPGHDEAAWVRNRRVEFVVLSK